MADLLGRVALVTGTRRGTGAGLLYGFHAIF
jgi:hypothetical protein